MKSPLNFKPTPFKPKPKTVEALQVYLEPAERGDVRIMGTTNLLGCPLHVDLIEVDRENMAVNSNLQKWIDAIVEADDGHGERYCTVKIGRKKYFPIFTPYQK